MQGSTGNVVLSGLLVGLRRPGKLIAMARWSKEVKVREQRKFILAAGWRVAGKSYRRVLEGCGRAAWWLGLPDCPVFPAPLANYDWRRFDRPQHCVARKKNIAVRPNFKKGPVFSTLNKFTRASTTNI